MGIESVEGVSAGESTERTSDDTGNLSGGISPPPLAARFRQETQLGTEHRASNIGHHLQGVSRSDMRKDDFRAEEKWLMRPNASNFKTS